MSVIARALPWALAVFLTTAAASADEARPRVLVELFTSQGCSSCPPADALAGQLAERADVVVLSFHVNYWDYIGWTDPFATEDTTGRQYGYAKALRQTNVYTPQMVIGGVTHVVGSDAPRVMSTIETVRTRAPHAPAIAIKRIDDVIRVSLGAGRFDGEADVLLAQFVDRRETDVRRGENQGRRLTNYNIVRDLARIGGWTGNAVDIDLDPAQLMGTGDRYGCAVIVQAPNQGPVMAAETFDMASLEQ